MGEVWKRNLERRIGRMCCKAAGRHSGGGSAQLWSRTESTWKISVVEKTLLVDEKQEDQRVWGLL